MKFRQNSLHVNIVSLASLSAHKVQITNTPYVALLQNWRKTIVIEAGKMGQRLSSLSSQHTTRRTVMHFSASQFHVPHFQRPRFGHVFSRRRRVVIWWNCLLSYISDYLRFSGTPSTCNRPYNVWIIDRVLTCHFLSGTRPGPTVGLIFTLYGFVKIGQTVAGISRFNGFSKWRPPPSWIVNNSNS